MANLSEVPDRATQPASRRARAWIEVDLAALRHNFRVVGRHANTPVLPMVKADAYGMGVARVVPTLAELGPTGWGVATVDEGVEVMGMGADQPVQIFSPLTPEDVRRALLGGLVPTLSSVAEIAQLPPEIQGSFEVEVDTGMGRSGFTHREVDPWLDSLLAELDRRGGLRWTGVFTHFHSADEPELLAARGTVQEQIDRFEGVVARIDERLGPRGYPRPRVHVANSAAALRFGGRLRRFDAVRPGIVLFGGSIGPEFGTRPVASVRARVTRVTTVPRGTTLGYAATYRARGGETWATLGIGYGDGLPRSLSNRGAVLVHGHRVPIIGRISMDMTVVDISEVVARYGAGAVKPGDVATLLGTTSVRGGEEVATIDLSEMAELARTIDYEILTGWTRRLPRIEIGGEEA